MFLAGVFWKELLCITRCLGPAVTLLEKESAQLSHNFAFTAEDADSPTYRLQTVSGMEISISTGNDQSVEVDWPLKKSKVLAKCRGLSAWVFFNLGISKICGL